jgi:hypothetical protein
MASWEAYPADYRTKEVTRILAALRAGECVSIIGLSGAGKSNLMGFLAQRCQAESDLELVLVDGNRAQPRTAEGLFRLARRELGDPSPAGDEFSALEDGITRRMQGPSRSLSLLLDRYDALSQEERQLAAGPLRALRDGHKYRLAYVMATRHPLNLEDELAELFYANTIWLGPLSQSDALWSARQYAARRGVEWDAAALARLVEISWGYPSLLRACCEAYAEAYAEANAAAPAARAALEPDALRRHPAVQRRVEEFWADRPSTQDLIQSGVSGQPLLGPAPAQVEASSPDLTASEHRLLAYFQAHPGEICAKDELIRAVWPEDRVIDGLRDDSLAQLIRRLRQKIEADPANPQHILTTPGRGYRYLP